IPFSKARLNRRTDRSSSTSPHQPVETVQTPKPTSETRMSVPARFRYLILDPSSRSKNSRQRVTTFYRRSLLTFSQPDSPDNFSHERGTEGWVPRPLPVDVRGSRRCFAAAASAFRLPVGIILVRRRRADGEAGLVRAIRVHHVYLSVPVPVAVKSYLLDLDVRRPGGVEIVSRVFSQGVLFGAVGRHVVDLEVPANAPPACECYPRAAQRPVGIAVVRRRVPGEIDGTVRPAFGGGLHRVDLVVIGAKAREGDLLAVRRPGGVEVLLIVYRELGKCADRVARIHREDLGVGGRRVAASDAPGGPEDDLAVGPRKGRLGRSHPRNQDQHDRDEGSREHKPEGEWLCRPRNADRRYALRHRFAPFPSRRSAPYPL